MAFRYPYNPSNSGFMLVFFSIWVSIHSAAAFPNPISILRRSEVACADANVNDSSGHRPRPLFCRPRDHPRRKPQQQHHQRRELISFRLWSSTGVDESSDNDNDLSNRKAKASSGVLAFLVTGYRRYLDLCRRRPFLTSSLTAGILAASGDALSQSIQAGRGWIFLSSTTTATTVAASFNWVRWRTFLLTGLLFEGPWVSFWYQGLWRLGRWMETSKMKVLTSSRLQVLVQTVIDQTVGVSIFFPLYFLVYEIIGAVVSGGVPDLRAALHICRAELPAILLAQYKVWPAVNWINFTYVPEPLRVLVSGVVALFWNIYLTAKVAGGVAG